MFHTEAFQVFGDIKAHDITYYVTNYETNLTKFEHTGYEKTVTMLLFQSRCCLLSQTF